MIDAKTLREFDPFDSRNIRDGLKGLPEDLVRSAIAANTTGLRVAVSNTIRDFNLASAVRSCNAFGVSEVVIVGKRKWDRRGAVGTHRYTPVTYVTDIRDAIGNSRVVALEYDPARTMTSLYDYEWHGDTLLLVGEESVGMPEEWLDLADDVVYIPMRGSVRSLNMASATTTALAFYNAARAAIDISYLEAT